MIPVSVNYQDDSGLVTCELVEHEHRLQDGEDGRSRCIDPKPHMDTIILPLERECEACGGRGCLLTPLRMTGSEIDCKSCNGTGKETWILVRGTGLELGEYDGQVLEWRENGYVDVMLIKREA